MFTGIVSDIGTIRSVEPRGDLRVTIDTAYDPASIDLGASISCSGVCLTVVDKGGSGGGHGARHGDGDGSGEGGGGWFAVDVSGETASRTAQGQWRAGARLNLERAMKLGEELGGHIVTGHVDGIAEVTGIVPDGDSRRVDFRVASDLAPFLAAKGSVTVDGVSLTVNAVEDGADATAFSVNIIPHTQAVTTLADLDTGRAVNIEIDVLARYLQRMEHYRVKTG